MTEIISESPLAKPRRPLKTAILLAVVAALLLVAGAAGFLLMQSRTIDRYFAAGNNRFDKALARLDKSLDELAKVRAGEDAADLTREARRIGRQIPAARADLAAARKSFERMRKTAFTPWEARTAALLRDSAREAMAGTDDLEAGLKRLSVMAEMLVKVTAASDKYNEGFAKTNESITAGNENKYPEAKAKAAEADKLFSEAQTLLIAADKIASDAKLEPLIPALSKGREWATGAEKMAGAGEAKQIAVYNELVKENNRLSEEVADIGRNPVIADPREWFNGRLDELNAGMDGHFNKADRLRERALRLWGRNT